jgi:predicted transcriptional regulator
MFLPKEDVMNTTTVNVSFQKNLLREIDVMARMESRNRSEFLREAARAYIQRKRRFDDVLAMGHNAAAAKGLTPDDVAKEIRAHRKSKAARS